MAGRHVQFGTLSFAKDGEVMVLPADQRVAIILEVATRYRPDMLITAGYAVDSVRELSDLARTLGAIGVRTTLITEIHHESASGPGEPGRHAMWMVCTDSARLHRFGGQAFGRARETREPAGDAIVKLRMQLPERTVRFRDWNIFGLICGEINIVHGRERPRFVCPQAGAAIIAADIVVNPTHDRMGNAGTLIAKRKLLSRRAPGGRHRLYVSCSNWDVSGEERGVQHPSPTLHTAYRSGEALPFTELADGRRGFVYRHWRCAL